MGSRSLLLHHSKITQNQPGVGAESLSIANGEAKDEPLKLYGLRILVVDDDDGARESISLFLKTFGAEVLAVASAGEALEALPTFKPTILVSDIAMPGEDGYSLIRKIRGLSRDNGGNIPALALSACATEEDAKHALAAGFQAHVAKPVEANNLGQVILKYSKQKNTV